MPSFSHHPHLAARSAYRRLKEIYILRGNEFKDMSSFRIQKQPQLHNNHFSIFSFIFFSTVVRFFVFTLSWNRSSIDKPLRFYVFKFY